MFKLLLLLFVVLVLLLKSQNNSKKTFFDEKVDIFNFDNYKKLLFLDTFLLILLFIISFRLFLARLNTSFVYFYIAFFLIQNI